MSDISALATALVQLVTAVVTLIAAIYAFKRERHRPTGRNRRKRMRRRVAARRRINDR